MPNQASSTVAVPRIAIKFCTQCKWNLRAAYFAQELLQTFGTSIGEVALQPETGGIFTITMTHVVSQDASAKAELRENVTETVIWDRKQDGGFPETKELKNRVRNIIEPGRDLGHIDRSLKKSSGQKSGGKTSNGEPNSNASDETSGEIKHDSTPAAATTAAQQCEDCK